MSISFSRFVKFSYMIVFICFLCHWYDITLLPLCPSFKDLAVLCHFKMIPCFVHILKKVIYPEMEIWLSVKSTGFWNIIQTVKNKSLDMINGDFISTKQGRDIQTPSDRHACPLNTGVFLIWYEDCLVFWWTHGTILITTRNLREASVWWLHIYIYPVLTSSQWLCWKLLAAWLLRL